MLKVSPILTNGREYEKLPKINKDDVCHHQIEPVILPTMTTPRSLNAKSDIQIQNIKARRLFEEFLNKKGRVSFEEYLDIMENHPAVLIETQKYVEDLKENKFFYTSPKLAAQTAILSKKRLDNLFGKDKYKLISIGTSPSFITESMKELGVDTIFLPVSNASYITNFPVQLCILSHPNLAKTGEYLKSKCANPENKDNRKIIVLDYCNKGRTLELVRLLAQEYLGLDEKQVIKMNISDLLHGIRASYIGQYKENKIEYDPDFILNEIDSQRVECMSNVPHFSVYDDTYNLRPFSIASKGKTNKELFKEFDEFSRPSARAYQLCVLHELNNLGDNVND